VGFLPETFVALVPPETLVCVSETTTSSNPSNVNRLETSFRIIADDDESSSSPPPFTKTPNRPPGFNASKNALRVSGESCSDERKVASIDSMFFILVRRFFF
jgi:hypothetical protein